MDCALDQEGLAEPWPDEAARFEQRRVEGKARLGLLAQEICRLAAQILDEWTALQRKLPQARPWADAYADLQHQQGDLMGKFFLRDTPYVQLKHFPRYFKAAQMRIEKLRSDPQRDARLMADIAMLSTPFQRARTALKGAPDRQLDEFRWLIEELRVALFAQTLRTPFPVSVKRLQKAWSALQQSAPR